MLLWSGLPRIRFLRRNRAEIRIGRRCRAAFDCSTNFGKSRNENCRLTCQKIRHHFPAARDKRVSFQWDRLAARPRILKAHITRLYDCSGRGKPHGGLRKYGIDGRKPDSVREEIPLFGTRLHDPEQKSDRVIVPLILDWKKKLPY